MELKNLRAFVAVADTLSFSRAAMKIFISQSTLSYRIAVLENELNTKLFSRSHHGVSLTPEGEELYERAVTVIKTLDEIELMFVQRNGAGKGKEVSNGSELDIAMPDFTYQEDMYIIRPFLDRFAAQRPNTSVNFTRIPHGTAPSVVESGKCDIATVTLRDYDKLPEQLHFHVIHIDRYMLLASGETASSGLSVEELLRTKPLIMIDTFSLKDGDVHILLDNLGVDPEIIRVKDLESSFRAVERGTGVTFWPNNYYQTYLRKRLEALEVPGKNVTLSYGLIWHNGNTNPALLDLMKIIENEET